MPIYEYKCDCGVTFETIQSMNDPKLVQCNPKVHSCDNKGNLRRLISKPLIQMNDRGTMTDKKLYKELDIDK